MTWRLISGFYLILIPFNGDQYLILVYFNGVVVGIWFCIFLTH